ERVDLARQFLEGTSLSVEAIAARCGFGSVQLLRHHFGRALHVPPTVYRERFRAAPVRPRAGSGHAGKRILTPEDRPASLRGGTVSARGAG
ncbi:MAG: helix-turn-helix domain-containing protein, partial [Betaproteobacteria bacterium]